MPQSFKERRAALQALGFELTPEMVGGTVALAAPTIDPAIYEGVAVAEDLAYGEHERHILDVYSAAAGSAISTGSTADDRAGRPVLVYVHGGGFVRGAKDSDTTPYFRNIGSWAVQQGWVAVVIDYRLAPEFQYPAGAEDVAGAIIVSCLYDVGRARDDAEHRAYWGDDLATWARKATLDGLIATELPLALAVSEFDEPEFQDHAAGMVARWHAVRGGYPPMHFLYSQNHLTPVYSLGGPDDGLGPILKRFIEVNG